MISLYRYNMAYTFRKISTWVILGVLFLLCFLIILGTGLNGINSSRTTSHVNVLETMQSVMIFILAIPIIISVSYISLKAANIFKDGEKDGTTLLIVSKPFTRKEIILSKCLSALTHTFLPAIIFFLSFFIGDIIFDIKFIWTNTKYILTCTLGIFVIDIIFMSISLLIASVMGKTGTSILTMTSFLFIWIAGFILPPMGRAGLVAGNAGNIYNIDDNKFKSAISGNQYVNNKLDRYTTFAYFDIWYQISGPFELMSNNPSREYLANVKPRTKDEQNKLIASSKIMLEKKANEYDRGEKEKPYYFYVRNDKEGWYNGSPGWNSKKIIKSINNDKDIKSNVEKTTKALQNYFNENPLPKLPTKSDSTTLDFYRRYHSKGVSYSALYVYFRKYANVSQKNIQLSVTKGDDGKINLWGQIDSNKKELISNSMVSENFGANLLESFKSLKKVKDIPNLYNNFYSFETGYNSIVTSSHGVNITEQVEYKGKEVPYIAPWARSVIWIIISMLMVTGVVIVYMRRDFK